MVTYLSHDVIYNRIILDITFKEFLVCFVVHGMSVRRAEFGDDNNLLKTD